MPFNVYPEPQTAPLPLIAGAAMPLPLALADHSGPDPTAFNLLTSFIRISMSGTSSATPPQVGLTAVHPSLTQGAEVNITATTLGTAQALLDGTNATDAASAYFFPPHANNVYLLKVVINIAGTTLKIRITNNTAANRDFVWVVADSDADSQQPWINATPATLVYNALINQASSLTTLTVSVQNRGTGSLTVSSFTPALPANYTASGLPVTVLPNAPSGNIPIAFNAPATPATLAAALFTLDGDSGPVFGASHNREVTLSATTRALELALLLDDSGSMSWQPNGDPIPPAAPPSRWSLAASAANAFLDLLAVFGRNNVTNTSMGTFGVARFPAPNPINPSSFDLIAPIPIPMSMAASQTTISNNLPFFAGTPMGDAINRVLTPGANYFSTNLDNRRWIVLMTDGAENSSTINSLSFVAPPAGTAAPGASLNDKKIKLFGVGFGVLGQEEVNLALIDTLATGSFEGGVPTLGVDSSPTPAPALAAALRTAIKSGLVSASSPADPGGTLTSAFPEARHRVLITPYDTKIAFLLNWTHEDANRMRLHLLTPTCDLITPESAGPIDSGEIGFSGASRYQLYRIEDSFLRNKANPANPRYGNWTMIVFSDQLGSPTAVRGSESYEYDVIVESRLQMNLSVDRARYFAGDPIRISATLSLDGKPITGAAVSLSLTAPGQAVGNWLAGIRISADEFRRAEAQVFELTGKDTNALFIKAFAAKTKKIVFDNPIRTSTLPMTDPGHQGVYSATLTQTATPDRYAFYVTAVGTTEDGVLFRREGKVALQVGVRPDPVFSLIDIKYSTVLVNERPFLTATLSLTPRDRFGNVLLVDPAIDHTIALTSRNAAFSGPLTTSHDGTYSRSLRYALAVVPVIDLKVAGEKLFPTRSITPVTKLVYVDHVLDFKPGAEAQKGANRHGNRRDVLGNVLTRKPDVFLSLGAYGVLTVGVKGHSILALGNEDVTVFVQANGDQRRYSVEALPAGQEEKWVKLGEAAGTRSFSLRKARLKSATAIRITDLSGRIRNGEFKPDAAPGVSIVGVGVRKVGNAAGGGTLDNVVGAVVGILADGTEYRQVLTNPAEGKSYTGPDGRKWIAVHEVVVAGKVTKDPFTLMWRLQC
ncbi:MAG: vWA domain-containing protein [Accumulibacter sp.]